MCHAWRVRKDSIVPFSLAMTPRGHNRIHPHGETHIQTWQ